MKKSWMTSTAGAIAALGSALIATSWPEGYEWVHGIEQVFSILGTLGLGLAARDNNVSSEQAGIK